jgi:succinate dehydrogenase/fumarate reductase flavoprotein subunit
MLAVLAAVVGLALAGPAVAQAPAGGDTFKQIKLTDAQVKGFIAAQQEMASLAQQQGNQPTDKPDPKVQAQLDAIAKKHGFQSFVDFDDIAFNISMVMGGLDPQTGVFTDPVASIKKEIADIQGDKSIPEKDKKQILDELSEALKHTPPLQHPENVEVVKRHRVELEKVLQ